jgi:hypothetical protein
VGWRTELEKIMMLSSRSSFSLQPPRQPAWMLSLSVLNHRTDSFAEKTGSSSQTEAAQALSNLQQIVQHYVPAQSQRVLQHQENAQSALTVVIPIQPEKQKELKEYLEQPTDPVNQYFSYSPSTHFVRFVILQDESQGIHQPHLLFSSTHDGSFESYMEELAGLAQAKTPQGDVLNEIFQCCQGYPSGTVQDAQAFSNFIHQHALSPDTFFMAYWGKTVPEIQASQALCDALHEALESPSFCAELSSVCDRLPPTRDIEPQKPTSLKTGFLEKALESALEKYWAKIRSAQNDPSDHLQPNPTQLERRLASKAIEDNMAQNQFLTLHRIYPGFLGINLSILKIILKLAARRAKKAKGNLSGIATIHALRWVIIPSGILGSSPYLLFESNYNGSWDSYVDDFVQYAYRRMNLIWGKCIDYRSRGAKDAEWFKQHVRNYLFPAQAYYSAYPDLTVRNILTCLRVAEILKIEEDQVEPEQIHRVVNSFRLFLAGAYHSIN